MSNSTVNQSTIVAGEELLNYTRSFECCYLRLICLWADFLWFKNVMGSSAIIKKICCLNIVFWGANVNNMTSQATVQCSIFMYLRITNTVDVGVGGAMDSVLDLRFWKNVCCKFKSPRLHFFIYILINWFIYPTSFVFFCRII